MQVRCVTPRIVSMSTPIPEGKYCSIRAGMTLHYHEAGTGEPVVFVHGLVTKLGFDRCILLGNSLGGAIALKYTLDHPDIVSKLILMAPGGLEELPTYLQMEGIQKMIQVFTAGPMDMDAMRRLLTLQLHDPSLISEELLRERVGVCADQPR